MTRLALSLLAVLTAGAYAWPDCSTRSRASSARVNVAVQQRARVVQQRVVQQRVVQQQVVQQVVERKVFVPVAVAVPIYQAVYSPQAAATAGGYGATGAPAATATHRRR